MTGVRPSPAGERDRRLLSTCFFLSGACSLVYEVVWLRLAFAAFGVNTEVMSVVLSVFMAGQALGAWLGGHWITRSSRRSSLRAYAVAEAVVGAGALAVPGLLGAGRQALLALGTADSSSYLFWSAAAAAGALLPWCIAMGATFPLAMAWAGGGRLDRGGEFGFLYRANVLGAATGALTTAVLWVELAGFSGTLRGGAAVNLLVAAAALWRSRRTGPAAREVGAPATPPAQAAARGTLPVLFVTGFAAMGMEVGWVRGFTWVLGSDIYAFAFLVTTYLVATWAGTCAYRRRRAAGAVARPPAVIAAWTAVAAPLPVLLGDPRLAPGPLTVLASIVPFCALLGSLTPALVDGWSGGRPREGGRAYAVNILGCILGPLAASYILLPALGAQWSLAALAVPLLALPFVLTGRGRPAPGRGAPVAAAAALLLFAVFGSASQDRRPAGEAPEREVRRDATATVVSEGTGMGKRLFVNGIGLTLLSPVTKNMAHLPMVCLDHPARRALVICLGMGTTFRSMASWGVETTAVELVPSVAMAFAFYFPDGPALLRDPRFRIVVDDGRRFLARTREVYDVITLDPPPPIEAAGSSLLYSREFYELARAHLAPGGILQQWFPGGDPAVMRSTALALTRVFPHTRGFMSSQGWGAHVLASDRPIRLPDAAAVAARLPAAARNDLTEWSRPGDARSLRARLAGAAFDLADLAGPAAVPELTDDRPVNEYYLLRRARTWLAARGRRP